MPGQERVEDRLVTQLARLRQLELFGTAIHQQLENVFMTELTGHHVRGLMLAESPDVYGPASVWILLGEVLLGNTHANTRRIAIKVFADQFEVAERGGHEDVRAAAASHQVARDILPAAYHVLGRGRFMIDIQRVDLRAVIQ